LTDLINQEVLRE